METAKKLGNLPPLELFKFATLSPKGNPPLKTLPAVLKAVGIKFSVEAGQRVSA
jgi:DNA-binding phage protein